MTEQANLCRTWSKNPNTGFLILRLFYRIMLIFQGVTVVRKPSNSKVHCMLFHLKRFHVVVKQRWIYEIYQVAEYLDTFPNKQVKVSTMRAHFVSIGFKQIVFWILKTKSLLLIILIERRHEKSRLFAYAKTMTQISFAVTAKLISAFVFATRIVQSLFYLNPKFQASSFFLRLCRLVCVRLGGKP